MSKILKNTLIYISIIGVLLFGMLPISYAKNCKTNYFIANNFSSRITFYKKAEQAFYALKQISDVPASSSSTTEESDDVDNFQEELKDTFLNFNTFFCLFHTDNIINVQFQKLNATILQAPKVSLVVLFHSWKSYQS